MRKVTSGATNTANAESHELQGVRESPAVHDGPARGGLGPFDRLRANGRFSFIMERLPSPRPWHADTARRCARWLRTPPASMECPP
jgi:hypothetical protein